ncbi:MAG: sensor histidine kinase [Vulcanimicrobiaceae bacterium]
MRERLGRGGLRAQLTLAIAFVSIVATGVTFLALYSGTGSRLRAQIDGQLRTQVQEWQQARATSAPVTTAAELRLAGARFIAAQRYHAESQIIVIQTPGAAPISNDEEVVAAQRTPGAESQLLTAPAGLTTVTVKEAGDMRELAHPISYDGTQLGALRVAIPLSPVDQAQASMLRTFAIIGGLVLLASVIAGAALAGLLSAPLRRMVRTAVAVDAGDLSLRVGRVGGSGEAAALATAFDRMLARLERAFTRQREFVSDASHELRTPLTVLRAQIELLDREVDPQRRHEATSILLRRVDALDRLVADMLTLASAEAGQLIAPREVDLDDYFDDLRRDLPLFGERQFECRQVSGTLQADPDRLTQVLRNLIRNAVTHTDNGGRVTIDARARGSELEITVADDGPGIPPDELEHVFERFRRLDGGRSRDSGGTGLGLAIARAIVDAHGGRIMVSSPPGGGARFTVVLPGYAPPISVNSRI